MGKSSFGKYFKRGKDYKKEQTYIMYHGTTMQTARKIKRAGFLPSSDGMLGRGVYVSRSFQKAACYPKGAKGQERAVLELSVRVGKVKKIDRQGHPLQKSWHEAGYDTAWVPPNCGMVRSGRQENCIWDPRRIKVNSIQRNTYRGKDEESTDEEEDDDEEEEEEEEEEGQMSDTYDNDTDDDHNVASHTSGEDSTSSSIADDDDDDDSDSDSEETGGELSGECYEEQSDQSDEYQEQSDEFYEERHTYEEGSDDDESN